MHLNGDSLEWHFTKLPESTINEESVYPYVIMSNAIEITSDNDNNNTAYSIWVKKVGALYDVKVLNE